jgi:DNA replication and repair protein RecF
MLMPLIQLNVSHVRNLTSVSFEPITKGFNFFYGNNGSGKTSLLESIYYLSLGKSFRSTNNERVIHHSHSKLAIFAQILSDSGQFGVPVGLERDQTGAIQLRMNGKDAKSITEFAHLLPVQLIDSHCHSLLDAGPLFRRKYLDWGIFYSNKDFLRIWRQYQRALKQRNAALRGQISFKELEGWTQEVIITGMQLDQARRQYVAELMPFLEQFIHSLLVIPDLRMNYYSGWDTTKEYQQILHQNRERDFQLGYTQYGPHKADFKIFINGILARDILSRGQQKMFVCAMMLARGALLQSYIRKPIYLVDDLPSELDNTSRSRLLDLLSRQEAQIFVTATDQNDFKTNEPMKLFHVEHGSVRELT